jgi:hypothetical protein
MAGSCGQWRNCLYQAAWQPQSQFLHARVGSGPHAVGRLLVDDVPLGVDDGLVLGRDLPAESPRVLALRLHTPSPCQSAAIVARWHRGLHPLVTPKNRARFLYVD